MTIHATESKSPPLHNAQDCLLVYITSASLTEAQSLARTLVYERLAAGVNLLPQAQSYYWWQGTVREKQEYVLLAQTTSTAFAALKKRVCTLHNYDIPCIIALPIVNGHLPFLDWINTECVLPT